jgi:hypothetical protein
MAGHGDTNGDAPVNDLSIHRAGYDAFIGWFKWGAVIAFVVAAIVVVIIAS